MVYIFLAISFRKYIVVNVLILPSLPNNTMKNHLFKWYLIRFQVFFPVHFSCGQFQLKTSNIGFGRSKLVFKKKHRIKEQIYRLTIN